MLSCLLATSNFGTKSVVVGNCADGPNFEAHQDDVLLLRTYQGILPSTQIHQMKLLKPRTEQNRERAEQAARQRSEAARKRVASAQALLHDLEVRIHMLREQPS